MARCRRGTSALVIAFSAVVAMMLGGCASSSAGGPASDSVRGSGAAAAGPFFGDCGSVSEAELTAIAHLPPGYQVLRNTVGCQWDSAGDATDVSFSWYRGSPAEREHAIDVATGRVVRAITIDGHPGFSSEDLTNLCEVAVTYAGDFFLWSIRYESVPAGVQVCDVATALAKLTAGRAT